MCESKALRHGPLFLVLGRQKQEDLWSWLASQSSLSANFTERLYLEKYDGKAMEEDSKQRLWPPHVHTKIHKHPPHPHTHHRHHYHPVPQNQTDFRSRTHFHRPNPEVPQAATHLNTHVCLAVVRFLKPAAEVTSWYLWLVVTNQLLSFLPSDLPSMQPGP